MAKLGVERVHILAHDMGDTVAQELIARYGRVFAYLWFVKIDLVLF